MYVYVCVCMHVCMYVYVCVCMHVCMYVCVHAYMYVYTMYIIIRLPMARCLELHWLFIHSSSSNPAGPPCALRETCCGDREEY